MRTPKLTVVWLLLLVIIAYPPFSAAHSMPPSLWATMLIPHCEQNLDGFSARAKEPYAKWRQKHSDEVAEFESHEPTVATVPLQDAQRHELEAECEKVLNYIRDDVRSPDPRFATPIKALGRCSLPHCAQETRQYLRSVSAPIPAPLGLAPFMACRRPLADMANSLTGFELMGPEMHDYQEAAVSRSNGRAGIVSFVRTSRGWVISQM